MSEPKTEAKATSKSASKAKPKTENISSDQVLKKLNINKEDLEKLCEICHLGQLNEFTPEQLETFFEVIQRRLDGANSFAEAYAQMQAEVKPVAVESVGSDAEPDGVQRVFQETQQIAREDHRRVITNLHEYGGDLQEAVVEVYLTEMNALFSNPQMGRAVVTEEPQQLAKKPGLFTSRAREFLAAQAKSAALPPSAISSTETSSPE